MAEHAQPGAAETVGRRDFLRTGLAAVAGTAMLGAGVSGAGQSLTDATQIAKRTFGKTGLELPILGYGGAALPKAWLNPLTQAERVGLVRYAYDRGIRYFDTSPVHLESEAILGEALKDRRHQVCLVTKVENLNRRKPKLAECPISLVCSTPEFPMTSVRSWNVASDLRRLRRASVRSSL